MTEPAERDPDLAKILDAFAASGAYFKTGAIVCGAVGAVIALLAIARGIWFLVPVGVVFGVGLTWLMLWSRGKSIDPERSPVLRAIALEPERVVRVTYRTASSSSGAFKTHWLRIHLDTGKTRGIKVDEADIHATARALARRCPNAAIEVPDFRP